MKINEMLNIIDNFNTNEINLYMVHKVRSKHGIGYSVVNPTIENEFKLQLQTIVKNELVTYQELPQTNYNPVGTLDNVVERSSVDSVKPIKTLKSGLSNPLQKFRFKNSSFSFFIYEFPYTTKEGKAKSLMAFRRTKNLKRFEKGFVGYLISGTFQRMENSDMLATDEYIDFIMDDTDIYIFQHISFERIFNLRNKFVEKAKSVLSKADCKK